MAQWLDSSVLFLRLRSYVIPLLSLVLFCFPFLKVLNRLQSKYGSLYRRDNVILSGTHTHSAPAGYFQYSTFVIASGGFSNRTFEYMVAGIMKVGKGPQRTPMFFSIAYSVLGVVCYDTESPYRISV